MNLQYLDSNNAPAGPASLDQIRHLAQDGKIARDPMVRPLGESEWKLLSAVPAKRDSVARGRAIPVSSTMLGDFVGTMVKHVGRWLNPGLVNTSLNGARTVGHYAVLAGSALVFVLTIVTAIRANSFGLFLGGLGYVAALAVAQFTAQRFLGTADVLIANTPSRVSSVAFLECTGLLAVLGAAATLILGLTTAIQLESAAPLIPAVLLTVFWGYLGAIALHPELASIESGDGTAAEEAIGIVAFFFKAVLKTVPLFFALLACAGAIAVLVGIFARDSDFASALGALLSFLPLPMMEGAGFAGAAALLAAALLPMGAYFMFLLACLPLELWRAVLSIPGKLDAMRR